MSCIPLKQMADDKERHTKVLDLQACDPSVHAQLWWAFMKFDEICGRGLNCRSTDDDA